ncbi:hypothetical protein NP233_g9715 [Leucocoprinus birnbaumii]|uniref:Origin recognition complex subunit 3 n=1 Tax=Leucocoprinus birnbaumii TaxID=56174 RepID=A0AAD5VJX7_9AGAR|nr:hypothetical protein NP233_g9715 [Leucocoprinus birnbaumii]
MHNLDDPSQTSIYIPYTPQCDDEPEDKIQQAYLSAYKVAWASCSARLQTEVEELYKPTINVIIEHISTSHEDNFPGAPYPELPLIAVHGSSPLFVDTLLRQLSTHDSPVAVSHLYPSDAPNISTALRSLISNFLDSAVIRKSRLAAYDISLLDTQFTPSDPLLVVLHNFEQFEPGVMQDLLYICSTRIPTLHLTFLAFLSSPASPTSYIHAAYPRSTLTRLRMHPFSVQIGTGALERVLLSTFFDPDFEPDVMLGPSAIEGVVDYYTRHTGSIDALISSIQGVYLKHFLIEPLSILVHPPPTLSTDPAYAPIISLLRSRMRGVDPDTFIDMFTQHASAFRTSARAIRLGFTILRTTTNFLTSKGHRPFPSHSSSTSATKNLMLSTLRGHTSRDVKALTMYVKKLRPDAMHSLLTALYDAYPDGYDSARDQLQLFLTQAGVEDGESEDELDAEEVSTWFSTHLTLLLKPLDQNPLWDAFYTGSSSFPSDLLNPSPRATLLSALLRPYSFTLPLPPPPALPVAPPSASEQDTEMPPSPTVSDLEARLNTTHLLQPSTAGSRNETPSKQYMDSGKLINIYDWYESFKLCLDAQREERIAQAAERESRKGRRKGRGKSRKKSQSPKKKLTIAKAKGKGKAKALEDENEEQDVEMDVDVEVAVVEEPDEGSWQREVQARFMRALHELDYLGFIKHTGRRVEHVARAVFDVGDGDDQGEEEEEEGRQLAIWHNFIPPASKTVILCIPGSTFNDFDAKLQSAEAFSLKCLKEHATNTCSRVFSPTVTQRLGCKVVKGWESTSCSSSSALVYTDKEGDPHMQNPAKNVVDHQASPNPDTTPRPIKRFAEGKAL